MKRLFCLLLTAVITFSFLSCGDDYEYKVPEIAIDNYIDLFALSHDDVLKKYPFAISDYNRIAFNSNLMSPTSEVYNLMTMLYQKGQLAMVSVNTAEEATDNDGYLSYCEKLFDLLGEPDEIQAHSYTTNELKGDASFNDFKQWLTTENNSLKISLPHIKYFLGYSLEYSLEWDSQKVINGKTVSLHTSVHFSKTKDGEDINNTRFSIKTFDTALYHEMYN